MRSSRGLWLFVVGLWLAGLAGGWYVLLLYEFTPGVSGGVPELWRADTRLPHDSERATLVLFAHRNCPCTRTTFQELDHILTHAPGRARVHIVLLAPAVGATDRVAASIDRQSRALPGAEITIDSDGVEARRFHVRTSGHLILYGPEGRLLFSGGITESRGHAGDNAGRRAVLAWLHNEDAGSRTAPVYGCSLFVDEDKSRAEENSWDP